MNVGRKAAFLVYVWLIYGRPVAREPFELIRISLQPRIAAASFPLVRNGLYGRAAYRIAYAGGKEPFWREVAG